MNNYAYVSGHSVPLRQVVTAGMAAQALAGRRDSRTCFMVLVLQRWRRVHCTKSGFTYCRNGDSVLTVSIV